MLNIWWKPKGQMWITQKYLLETNNGKKECNNDFFFLMEIWLFGEEKVDFKIHTYKGGKS